MDFGQVIEYTFRLISESGLGNLMVAALALAFPGIGFFIAQKIMSASMEAFGVGPSRTTYEPVQPQPQPRPAPAPAAPPPPAPATPEPPSAIYYAAALLSLGLDWWVKVNTPTPCQYCGQPDNPRVATCKKCGGARHAS